MRKKKAMKKFDVSTLVVTKIYDVYASFLEEETEAEATAEHNVFVIKKGGRSVYEINGKNYLADANHVLFMPVGTKYSLSVEKSAPATIIEFDSEPSSEASVREYFFNNEKDIIGAAKNLLHYWKLQGPAYASKCLSELYGIMTQISTTDLYTHSLAGKYHLIHKSVKYIEANYNRADLYTPDLAEMSGIGETYYRSIFLSVFNCAPAKYIQNYRVDKAKELIIKSSALVEDVAIAVGFANASYFCKVFKSVTGMTPSEFAEHGRRLG